MARPHVTIARGWAWTSAGIAGVTTASYLGIIGAEGDDSWWEVLPWALLMLTGAVLAATAGVVSEGRSRRVLALSAAIVLGGLGLLSIFSIGLLFLLAAAAAGLAAATPVQRPA